MNPIPSTLRAVIVGTGRSGSGYIAQALTACGIRCGHEQVWGFGRRDDQLLVESSWMAVRFLPLRLRVWHQVRHPEASLRSRITAPGHARDGSPMDRWQREHGKGMPELPQDPVLRAMRRYVVWNLACEQHAEFRWRVEDVDETLISDLAARLDVPCDTSALTDVPTDTNRHTSHDAAWTLDDMPRGVDRDAVLRMGERYGYLT